MLTHELRHEPYNKRDHNRRLRPVLRGRSPGAIEFKHANISAILIELGFPYIDGYKPRGNYQDLLRREVVAWLSLHPHLVSTVQSIVDAPVVDQPAEIALHELFVPPPSRGAPDLADRDQRYTSVLAHETNYLEREARNSALGRSGEEFVLRIEHRRLRDAGRRALANRIEHVSKTRGDGLGYDVISFEDDGRERLIEVKTTAFGSMTPFFASTREVTVSETHAASFHLYRVFNFRVSPRIFVLSGSLRASCALNPTAYRASLM